MKTPNKNECVIFRCTVTTTVCVLCACGSVCQCCSSVATMGQDPLKVFIGQLHADLIKPDVLRWLGNRGIQWRDVHMHPNRNGVGDKATQCCFVTFYSVVDATVCTTLNGEADPAITPKQIKALPILRRNVEAFLVSSTQCL